MTNKAKLYHDRSVSKASNLEFKKSEYNSGKYIQGKTMTKIAIPVKDNTLTLVDNAGHTPKFAVFEMIGSGMFRSFKLQSIIDNPRTDLDDHDHDDEGHQCSHVV